MSGIRPKRRWGQNFLNDANISRKIVAAALDAPAPRLVIEIGPGQGALTGMLLASGDPYLGIEVDPQLADLLTVRFAGEPQFNLLQEDVLNVDLTRAANPQKSTVLAGNIPYNITTPILFHLFDAADHIFHAVLMMQKEVGDRLVAQPNSKAYGLLAINSQLFADVERLFTVPASVFSPRPKVDSVVIRLRFKKGVRDQFSDFDLFRKVIRNCFQQRRKMLRKSLSILFPSTLLHKLDANLTLRPEQLTIPQWIDLTEAIYRHLKEEQSG